MVEKVDIPWPSPVGSHKLRIALRPLILGVAREHALQTHAHALDVLYGTPALLAEQIETYYAVGVDVWVHGNRTVGELEEGYFGRFDRVLRTEDEFDAEGLAQVYWVCIEDLDVQQPFLEAFCLHECDSRWQCSVDLGEFLGEAL